VVLDNPHNRQESGADQGDMRERERRRFGHTPARSTRDHCDSDRVDEPHRPCRDDRVSDKRGDKAHSSR
jgi:hypothetical protein